MVLQSGEKVHIVTRRMFDGDLRRHFAGEVKAVAGFRLSEALAWGKYMYIDDLVTASQARSKGYGGQLFDWLFEYAAAQGCEQIHLDSGVQRKDAHRFYEREGMTVSSLHFSSVPGRARRR